MVRTPLGESGTEVIVGGHDEDTMRIGEEFRDFLGTLGVQDDDRRTLRSCLAHVLDTGAVEIPMHFGVLDEFLVFDAGFELRDGKEVVGDAIFFTRPLLARGAGDNAVQFREVGNDSIGHLRLARSGWARNDEQRVELLSCLFHECSL